MLQGTIRVQISSESFKPFLQKILKPFFGRLVTKQGLVFKFVQKSFSCICNGLLDLCLLRIFGDGTSIFLFSAAYGQAFLSSSDPKTDVSTNIPKSILFTTTIQHYPRFEVVGLWYGTQLLSELSHTVLLYKCSTRRVFIYSYAINSDKLLIRVMRISRGNEGARQ